MFVYFCVLDPFVFYRRRSLFIQQLSSNLDVNGLAVCDNRVFVIGISSPTIEVFDTVSYNQLQTLTVSAMNDPWDIAAARATTNSPLYLFDGPYDVLRLSLDGHITTRWMLDGSQQALSVSQRNSVLIAYRDRLDEFNSFGSFLRSVRLDRRSISHASHSLSLDAEKYVVCHGSGVCSISHAVCLVDVEGRILKRYQEESGDGSAYQPLHLALANNGCVLVADVHNRRVQILTQNLGRSYDVISVGRHHGGPLRVCYDSPRGNVYISTLNGKVLIYRIQTRDSLLTECLDVHSRLIPEHLTDDCMYTNI